MGLCKILQNMTIKIINGNFFDLGHLFYVKGKIKSHMKNS